MKNILLLFLSLILLLSCLTSCSLLGIHLKVKNPPNAGVLPEFSQETILLGEMTKYRSCFDVQFYDLRLNIDPKNQYLEGKVEIHATAVTDFDTLQIDLHPNMDITQLVDKATGEDLAFSRIERAVMVETPRKKGQRFTLVIDYDGSPKVAKKAPWKGGFVWKKDKQKNPWIGVACESEGASIWWPLKDHTADEPDSIRLHYTVPAPMVAVGNGTLEDTTEKDGFTTYTWFVSYPINTYNVTVYVGNFQLLEDSYSGIDGQTLHINHYVLPENYQKAKSHFTQLLPILKVFEDRFGAYPWYRDGFKLVESPYAGMEHQTAIAYGNKYKNDIGVDVDYIILHETAHEWWGNSVTATDMADVWIQEGFASYAEALFFEEVSGNAGYLNHMLFQRLFIKNQYPVVGVTDRRWFHYKKSSDVYMKGSWILHTLRNQIDNDSLFWDIILTFAKSFQYKLVNSQDFIQLVNQKTGSDYGWFFHQYLNEREVPQLAYAINKEGLMTYKWTNVKREFDQLSINMTTGTKSVELLPTLESQSIQLEVSEKGKWDLVWDLDALYAVGEEKQL
ncbi:MAG: M1 family metallopeptidase [Bacteroidota bacterium]